MEGPPKFRGGSNGTPFFRGGSFLLNFVLRGFLQKLLGFGVLGIIWGFGNFGFVGGMWPRGIFQGSFDGAGPRGWRGLVGPVRASVGRDDRRARCGGSQGCPKVY